MEILYICIAFICLVVPLVLTLLNIINLFKKRKIKENLIDILTFSLGIFLTVLLYFICGFEDYDQSLRIGGGEIDVHSPLASWSMPTVLAIFLLGIISYILIRMRKLKLPPLVIVGAMSGILICSIYMIIFIKQLSNNMIEKVFYGISYLMIFPINYILCSIRAEIEVMERYKDKNINEKEYNNKFLNKCSNLLYNMDNWPVIAIILSIPLTVVLICILDAHYLCTASLKGHKRLVKPIRMGIRRGEKIVVNRQLCVANVHI